MMRIGSYVAVLAALVGSSGCYVEPEYAGAGVVGGDGYVDGEIDPGYVATTTPVYYGGRASYWDGRGWRYREGGRWNAYRGGEPSGLRQYRPQSGYTQSTRRYEGGGRGGGHVGGGHVGGGHGGGGHGGGGHGGGGHH